MPQLTVSDLNVRYGRVIGTQDVSFSVDEGEIFALVGSNGAGKSTLLRSISGLLRPSAGHITFAGVPITRMRPDRIVTVGLSHVAEGRRLFRGLSVHDNLVLGLYPSRAKAIEKRERMDEVLDLFPMLRPMRRRPAGLLSGGQQQMLAIAQALLLTPKLIMLDEPSLGLAPSVIDDVFAVLDSLRRTGMALLLVEQVVERALGVADDAYVLRNGQIVGHGPGPELLASGVVESAYLGTADPGDRTRSGE
jgi:branched-chain amino acid transport system ATP-binding protein